MSADTLRQAAALMRERAEAAIREDDWKRGIAKLGRRTPKGQHMDGMSPAVALAVADWLDHCAAIREESADGPLGMAMRAISEPALAVATAYLGGDT